MKYLVCSTILVVFCAAFVVATEPQRRVIMPTIVDFDEDEVFEDSYRAVHDRDLDYEPAETRLHLLYLQTVLGNYRRKFLSYDQFNKMKYVQETNDLIAAAKINPQRCNKDSFEELQKLLKQFRSEPSVVRYLKYNKEKLGKLCDRVLDERGL